MKKNIFIKLLLLFLLVLPVLANPAFSSTAPLHLRIGYVPLTSQLPLVFPPNYGGSPYPAITVTLTKYTSFTGLEAALRIGAIDVASIPIPIALSMAVDEISIKMLGSIHTGGSTLFLKKTGYDLNWKDKVIGVPGLDSNENLTLKDIFSKENLRYGLDYKTISVPFNTALADLRSGRVDALYFPEPFGTLAIQDKDLTFPEFEEKSFYQELLSTLVIKSHLLQGENYIKVKEWLQVLNGACDLLENKMISNEVARLLAGSFSGETTLLSLKNRPGGLHFSLVPPDINEIQNILQKALQIKIIYRSVALDNLIHPDIMQEAMDGILVP